MVVYVCWCYFLHLSHSLLPWLWPWVHSLCLHLHSFPAGRFINTIFLDAIYIVNILYLFFSFWRTSLCITGSRFIYLTRTDSNSFFSGLSNIPLHICNHIFLIHLTVNRHPICFHILATINSGATSIGVHVSFFQLCFSQDISNRVLYSSLRTLTNAI